MINTISDCLNYIDDMTITESDYDIISSILETVDDRLFLKILEEVKNGNLYWSDFKQFLSNTNYPNILRDNLSEQKKLNDYMEKLINFRNDIKSIRNINFSDDDTYKNLNIIDSKEKNQFYTKEYEKIRDSIIYGILKQNNNDNELSILYKEMLYELIMNGKVTNGVSTGEFISVDDIFLFLSQCMIPIDYKYQTLDEYDILYMKNNGINENTMKKIKAVSIYLRQKAAINNSEGGQDETGA